MKPSKNGSVATTPKAAADLAQLTVIIDASGSMLPVEQAAATALQMVVDDSANNAGVVVAVREFGDRVTTLREFGSDEPLPAYVACHGHTALFDAVVESVRASEAEAALTPEIRTHHTFVVITDGMDNSSTASHAAARAAIAKLGAQCTWILLDMSPGLTASRSLGLKGIRMTSSHQAMLDVATKVRDTVRQLNRNVLAGVDPDTQLALPPAK